MSIKSEISKIIETQSEIQSLQIQNDVLANQLSFLIHGISLADIEIPFDKLKTDALSTGMPDDHVDAVIQSILDILIPSIELSREALKRESMQNPSIAAPKQLIILP